MDNTRLPKILLNGEINIGKRKVGRPQQNYRSCIKEDLKLFNIWNESPQFGSTQLPELTSNQEQWHKFIHKGAEIFQKEWERKKTEKSIQRKSNCWYRDCLVLEKSVLILCQFPMWMHGLSKVSK